MYYDILSFSLIIFIHIQSENLTQPLLYFFVHCRTQHNNYKYRQKHEEDSERINDIFYWAVVNNLAPRVRHP